MWWSFTVKGLFSPPLSWRFSPLSFPCCSALTCLFSSIISHTSQSWSNYSRLCGYIWFSFACGGDRHKACWTLFNLLLHRCFYITFSLFVVTDSALDDFVLMHCVFIPNSQLCPVLMAQYPFSTVLPNVVKCSFPFLWHCDRKMHCCDL